MKVLVTGANGFLGQRVVTALLGLGHQVRALVRPTACIENLGWPQSVEVVRGDLHSTQELASSFLEVDVLVHLAAAVSGSDEAQFSTTVTGTERLLAAMAGTGCRRMVLASSFSVYDWSAAHGTLDENSPLATGAYLDGRDAYAIAKSWQERITRRLTAEHGWDLTVLRPGFIWGRDHGYCGALGQRIGRLHFVIGPFSRLPLTHVDNCADLFARASSDPRAIGKTINVVDSPGPRIWGYLGHYLRGTGKSGLRIPVPYTLVIALVKLMFYTFLRRNLSLPGLLIPNRLEARMKPMRYSNGYADELMGWRPPHDYLECLRRTYG